MKQDALPSKHLVALPGGDWNLWRWSCLRGAGFPASLVLRLAAPEAAVAADRVLHEEAGALAARTATIDVLMRDRKECAAEIRPQLARALTAIWKGKIPPLTGTAADGSIDAFCKANERVAAALDEFNRVFSAARTNVFRASQELAESPRLREAVTWQNRGAVNTGFDSLLRCDPAATRARDRQHEALVANYVQRYTAKNDTIGFFGPVGWARLAPEGEAIVARPAENLLDKRGVYFEQWGIDALADKLSTDKRLTPWMAPRRMPFLRISGTSVHSAVNGKHELTSDQALVLAACNGSCTARELAAILLQAHPQGMRAEADIFAALRFLFDKKLIAWAFEIPLIWRPDEALRKLLARITDDALRVEALAPLNELDEAKKNVALAAGNPEQLGAALNELDQTFTRLTGASPTRSAGSMYAARMLVFEDCRRGMDLTIGPEVLGALGPALSLVLASARWFTFETARVYREAFRAIYVDLARKGGAVRFADLWFRAQRVLFGAKERPLDTVVADLQARWSELLSAPPDTRQVQFNSADLRPRAAEAFDAPKPGWQAARYHSPDVMIAAESVDAVRRGNYLLVLGELHASLNTLDYGLLFEQHPNVEEISKGLECDLPEPLVIPVYAKDSPQMTARMTRPFVAPWSYFLETGFDVARGPRERVLALGDLMVEEMDDQLVVRVGDGSPMELVELFGRTLAPIATQAFSIFPKCGHTPRVTIDRLVVCRESWTFPSSQLTFAEAAEEPARFVAARRWARTIGLPRFVFAKSPLEVKPVFVDFDSPLFVNLLAKIARAAKEHVGGEKAITLTEMLPGLHETWLPDATGERYTSELRLVAVDSAR